jgi:preprotein translocase subunit SecF
LVSGVYSTIFIANGCVYFWEKKLKQKPAVIVPAEAGGA